jgi:hypothetical protein
VCVRVRVRVRVCYASKELLSVCLCGCVGAGVCMCTNTLMHLGTRWVCVRVCARACVRARVCPRVCARIHFIYLCRTRKDFGGSKMSITAAFRSPLSRWLPLCSRASG